MFRLLFFVPLYLMELSTLALMAMSPAMRITRGACCALAGMFAVWAVWAGAFGFAYPATPGPLAVNVVSKLLCFAAAIALFAWRPDDDGVARPARRLAPTESDGGRKRES